MKKVLFVTEGGFLSQWRPAIEETVAELAEFIIVIDPERMRKEIETREVRVIVFTSSIMLPAARLLEQRYQDIRVVVYTNDEKMNSEIPQLVKSWLLD